MKRTTRHRNTILRFRRWSRKAYAAFASLGKVVLIRRVTKSITEASLSKVSKYSVKEMRHVWQQITECEEEPSPPDVDLLLTNLAVCIEPTTPAVPLALYRNEIINHTSSCSLTAIGQRAGRFVSIPIYSLWKN